MAEQQASAAGNGPRPASLRSRLTLLASLTLVVSLGVVGLALDSAYRSSAEVGLQQQMDTWGYSLMAAMNVAQDGSISLSVSPADPVLLQPGSGVYGLIQGDRDRWESASVLGVELPALEPQSAGQTGFQSPESGVFYQRTFGLAWELEDGSIEPVTVGVLVDQSWLKPELATFRRGLWQSLGAAAFVLALAQLLFAAISLRPLGRMASDVADVEAGRTDRLPGPYPRELEPLTRNIDHLLNTEKANQARYRNALDSLAHSLKTPLAVLKAGKDSDPARQQALADMELLIATRLERAAAGTRRALAAPLAVAPLVDRLSRSLEKVHSRELRKLQCNIAPGLQFYGEERDLMELLGNLLDNACKYGDGEVRLDACREGDGPRPGISLVVGNNGDVAALEGLVQRGLRGDERAVEGHGFGLNIVAELVSAYGGTMTFGQSSLGGSEVRIVIPAS